MKKEGGHSLTGVFVFTLLGLFAAFAVILSLMGAQVYQNTVEDGTAHGEERILTSFVRSAVRNQETRGGISVEEIAGLRTLTLESLDGDTVYLTRLFCRDGMLKEWYAEKEMPFEPEDGEAICRCGSFQPEIRGRLLTVLLTDGNGRESTVWVALRAQESEGDGT